MGAVSGEAVAILMNNCYRHDADSMLGVCIAKREVGLILGAKLTEEEGSGWTRLKWWFLSFIGPGASINAMFMAEFRLLRLGEVCSKRLQVGSTLVLGLDKCLLYRNEEYE